ncbi:RHS repeat-associated core domain-containing protein [Bacteroides sp.]|uniref:RHS repeat domain-containing protein n=1 Tax=Bacteroides sp. TaxID=29523 RepID=UPI002A8220F2|nr:RHS repeat-associated core domain-containing protein [Bacteroides sp.]
MNLLRKWVLVSLLLTIGVNVFAQESAYAYDANGNLTKNLNKNIVDIQYNCLNLPSRVLFGNGDNISNVYSGDGTKLRTIRVIGGDTLTTDYCGNAIYENGVLVRLMTEVGYITMADTTYHYFIKDHQGNVRVVADERGNVEEVNDYYPFGGLMSTSSRRSVQPYKYNGKELEAAGGLNWYDYGARQYDPVLGRWNGIDPLCEDYYSETPYGYCGNDPINYIDPNGLMKVVYNPDGTYKETTHNNWFHNTFVGRQEYIDYGDRQVHLSEPEFWQWQRTGSYENIGPVTGIISNLELTLDEPVANFADGAAKYVASSVYSYINSPKVWLTGSSWAGTYATPDERTSGFIDVATQRIPVNRLLKQLTPGSWYKFKYANQNIPVKNKHAVYDMEMRKYNERISNPKTFEKINESVNKAVYLKDNIEKENK